MATGWLESPYYSDPMPLDIVSEKEEEELTEEEKALLEMQMLLEQEEAPVEEEEVIEEQEEQIYSEVDSAWLNSKYFEDNKPLAEKGKQLEYVGTAEDIPFYYDKDQKNYVTVHTRGHKLEDGSFVNFPSLLPNGRVIYSLDPKTEKEIFNYWKETDPSKIEFFRSEQEAELAAKEKSKMHNKLGLSSGIIKEQDELTFEEATEFGARLERHTIGNVLRLLQAGVRTVTDNVEYEDAIKQIENERQDVIFNELKEKYGKEFRGQETDARVMAGRITTAFFDPVTFVIPWAKAAKLGKIAATGFGAGVGVTDMAIYEYAAYGEVNKNSLLFAGGLGGLSSLGGKVIGDRMIAPTERNVVLGIDEAGEKIVKPVKKMVDEPKITLNAKEAESLDNSTSFIASEYAPIIKDLEILPKINRLYNLNKKNIDIFRDAKDIKRRTKKQKGPEQATIFKQQKGPQLEMFTGDPIFDKYGASFKTLKARADKSTKYIEETHPKLLQKAVNGEVELTDGVIKDLAQKNELTDDLLTKILYEAVRPILGGGIGWGIGVFVDDDAEDDDNRFTYALTGAGMFLGAMQKRIQVNPYLTKETKEKAFGILENQQSIALHNFLKYITAGTTHSKAVSLGGANEVLSNALFHSQSATSRFGVAAEPAIDLISQSMFQKINKDVIGQADENVLKAAWWIARDLEPLEETIKRFSLTKADIEQAQKISINGLNFADSISNDYAKKAGVDFIAQENWGLPQVWTDKINIDSEAAKQVILEASKVQWGKQRGGKIGRQVFRNVTENNSLWKDKQFKGIPILENFYRERKFTNPEAIKILADGGVIETSMDTVLKKFVHNSVKGIEFGRVTGMTYKGKDAAGNPIIEYNFLNQLQNQIEKEFNTGVITKVDYDRKMKNFKTTVDLFFNRHGKALSDSQVPKNIMSLLTFLGNSTMLTRTAITQLGDLVQPFQNSASFWSPVKAMLSKKDFAEDVGAKYISSYQKDVRSLFAGADPSNRFQQNLGNANQMLFKYNLMTPMTDIAERFAFNSGIQDAFSLANKHAGKTLRKNIRKQLNRLSLKDKDLVTLSKFKTVDDAFNDPTGQLILIRAGKRAQSTDSLVTGIGNRLAFAQHKDPFVRSLGMFLSWAQAKTAQVNGLVNRIEDGDVALAVKMLGGITIFGGIRELQIAASPAREYYEENAPTNWSPKWWQEALTLSGNIPWTVEKVARTFNQNAGQTTMESLTPVVSYVNKLGRVPKGVTQNLNAEDYEGAFVDVLQVAPLGRDVINIVNRIYEALGINKTLEDEPNRQDKKRTVTFFEGGKVSLPVPNAAPEPSERVNPYTGQPYEAEMERLGFKDGGSGGKRIVGITEDGKYYLTNYGKGSILVKNAPKKLVDKWKRLQKKDGLLVSIGVAPVSEKQIDKLKKGLKKRKAMREGGSLLSDDQRQYIEFYNMAVEAGNDFPEMVAAQASLESGHGKSELAMKYNNPLGIKVNRPSEIEQGQEAVQMSTKEFVDGKEIEAKEPFRVYDNMAQSFVGYKEKVAAERYDAIREATTKEEYAQAIQASGYATDPDYASKIINIANRYQALIK